MLGYKFRTYLPSSPATVRISLIVLLFALSLPLLVHGQMGGMGGGGLMGGMGGEIPGDDARSRMLLELEKNPVQWNRPEGDAPFWLQNGKAQAEALEMMREKLSEPREVSFEEAPLEDVVKKLNEDADVQFELNLAALTDVNADPAKPVTINYSGPRREILRRILEPLALAFIVRESSIEITSKNAAEGNLALRVYDLGFVQSDSKKIVALVNAIEQSIEPDDWIYQGGNGTISVIGQMLVVSATEKAHSGIEMLLYRLAPANP